MLFSRLEGTSATSTACNGGVGVWNREGKTSGLSWGFWNGRNKSHQVVFGCLWTREEASIEVEKILILRGGGGRNIKLFFSSYVDEEEEGHERFD
jgi:hypothetical protein